MKLIPENKRYTIVLALFVIGASLFLVEKLPENYEPVATTAEGRPIIERDGKTLLWAGKDTSSFKEKWFDMTDSPINPERFDHGSGADFIPSIEKPVFISKDDPRWAEYTEKTNQIIIGVVVDGEARAYPRSIMNQHEIVNDSFGNAHMTVAY